MKYLLSICLFVALCACSTQSKYSGASLENYYIDSDSIPVISLTNLPEFNILSYSDVYQDVKMVKLETTEKSILGRVTSVELLPNNNILVFDIDNMKVLLFDETGKFLTNIGVQGKGGNEFQGAQDVKYDRYADEIIVWDFSTKRLMFFDTSGHFLRNVDLPWWIGAFCVLDNEHFALFMNYMDRSDEDYSYNVRVIKKDGTPVAQGIRYNNQAIPLRSICSSVFSVSADSRVLCNQEYSSVIFDVNQDSVLPRYQLDFGDNSVPKEWLGFYDYRDLSTKVVYNPDICFCSFFCETENAFVLKINRGGVVNMCVVSKDGIESIKYATYFINDIYGGVSTANVYSVAGDKVISVLNPSFFVDLQQEIKDNSNQEDRRKRLIDSFSEQDLSDSEKEKVVKLKEYIMSANFDLTSEDLEFINSFDGSENPVIQIATLKK